MLYYFVSKERLQIDPVKVISVIQEAASILHKEQNVLNLKAPIVVYTLLLLLKHWTWTVCV